MEMQEKRLQVLESEDARRKPYWSDKGGDEFSTSDVGEHHFFRHLFAVLCWLIYLRSHDVR